MTVLIHLVRHGAHDQLGRILSGRAPGVGLSGEGREQVRMLGRRLANAGIDAILTSPSQRTRETAGILAEEIGPGPRISDLLDEIDFGHWSGKPFSDLEADPDWRSWNQHRDVARTPGGETMKDVAGRLVAQIEQLCRDQDGRTIALVSHSDVIKAGVCHYLGIPFQHVFDFEIDPASVTTIVADQSTGIVVSRNADGAAHARGMAA